jgi:RimJ/RimL family protein N-acetyltransferase
MTPVSNSPVDPPGAPGPLSLHPLTAAGARQIERWFDDPEVQHRLGGRSWIHQQLRLIGQQPGGTFRGKTVLRSHGWIALDQARTPVAFIGGDIYDRWARYLGEGPHGALTSEEDLRRSMGLGYVVDPARWRRGHGRTAVKAVLDHADVADVEVFYCGIDADNHASRRCAMAAGFHLIESKPDFEGTLYFRRERKGQNASIHKS